MTLVISGVLTHQGREASRAHAETVERLLKDHAASAAGRYAEQAEVALHSIIKAMYLPYRADVAAFDPNHFKPLELPAQWDEVCACAPEKDIEYHFAYDYAKDTFSFLKGKASATEVEALRGRLKDTSSFAKLVAGSSSIVAGKSVLGRPAAVMAIVQKDSTDKPRWAVGFVGKEQMLGPMFTPVTDFNKAFYTAYEPKPDRFEIAVLDGETVIYRGGIPGSDYFAAMPMQRAFGGFQVKAWINPRDVPLLAGSDVPSSRGPFFFGLLSLSALLIMAVLFLFKRESELAEARSNFLAGVSHELRTPLAQIRMFTETLLLGRTRNDAERRRSLEIIDQEARRLTALVDNVLNLGRAERGAVRLAPAAAELAPIVREVVETFSQLPRARSIELRAEVEPRLIATVDTGAFRQILLNLLDNAAKYGPVGQRVLVGLAMFEENARLWVDDEGPGIPVRDRQRIFEPFFRSAGQAADARVSGSGIGLAVVRELSTLLGGTVRAEDAPGGGARFVVEFPEAYLRAEEAASNTAVA